MSAPLLRGPVLRLTRAGWFRGLATGRLGRLVASRFVAGETLDAAIETARAMKLAGRATILDHLGENVTEPDHAAEAAADYVRALDRIEKEADLDVSISVKLTQLGLDFSTELTEANLERVLEAARGRVVMIDMESSAYVDRTLQVYRSLRSRTDRVGLCLQSYLRRTARDVETLPDPSVVRLVKGAYLEPPEVAFEDRRGVDRSFARLTVTLLARGHTLHLATHDPRLLDGALALVERWQVPLDRIDLQFLHGVRRDLQSRYAERGLPVTVYVPYGTEWYPYLTRRLAERPANMWFFLSNLLRVRR